MEKVRKTPVCLKLTGATLRMEAVRQLGSNGFLGCFKRCVQGFIKGGVGKHEAVQSFTVVLTQKQQLRSCNKVRYPVPQRANARQRAIVPHYFYKARGIAASLRNGIAHKLRF